MDLLITLSKGLISHKSLGLLLLTLLKGGHRREVNRVLGNRASSIFRRRIGPRKFFVAANWKIVCWQIGSGIFFGPLENVGAANWAPGNFGSV